MTNFNTWHFNVFCSPLPNHRLQLNHLTVFYLSESHSFSHSLTTSNQLLITAINSRVSRHYGPMSELEMMIHILLQLHCSFAWIKLQNFTLVIIKKETLPERRDKWCCPKWPIWTYTLFHLPKTSNKLNHLHWRALQKSGMFYFESES